MVEELFSREMIAGEIRRMGTQISRFYEGKDLTVVALMNGGAFFACDLVREMNIPLWFDSLRASSYIHDRRNGAVLLANDLKLAPAGRHILLADDIFDSGETVKACREHLLNLGALSVKTAVLVNKKLPGRTSEPDWAAVEAPDRYLAGFGMDSEEFLRNLPFIGAMVEEN